MAKLSDTSAGNLGKYVPGVISIIEAAMKSGTKIQIGTKTFSVSNSQDNKTTLKKFAKLAISAATQKDALDLALKTTSNEVFRIGSMEKPKTVSTSASGEVSLDITGKSLTPNSLKIHDKKIKKNAYLTTVKAALKTNFDSSKENKEYIVEFLEVSGKTGIQNPLTKGKTVTKKDVATIAKDFGEVAGAWWFINNHKDKTLCGLDFIEFPKAINEPLVDYYVGCSSSGLKIGISAKAKAGAAPALKSIWKAVADKVPKSPLEKTVWEFIKISVLSDGLTSLVELNKHYNSTAYGLVQKLIKKDDFTWGDVENWFSKYHPGDGTDLYKKLDKEFYSKLPTKRQVKADAIEQILVSKGAARAGIILSPMNYSLMDEINENKQYTNYLNKVARTLGVEQLYVYLKPSQVSYNSKPFTKADFEFAYWSNAGKPANNKWGFKMVGSSTTDKEEF
jgi:hypothetical protein